MNGDDLSGRAEVVGCQVPAGARHAADAGARKAGGEHGQDEAQPTPELLRSAVELRVARLHLEGRYLPVRLCQLGLELLNLGARSGQSKVGSFACPPPRGRTLRPRSTRKSRITRIGDPSRAIVMNTSI